jgi:hypothetical protein
MEETNKRLQLIKKLAAVLCIFIGGSLIFLDGYYWSFNSRVAYFLWSGASRMTWWSPTGHIPLSYWGMICGALVIFSAVLTLVPKDSVRSLGCALAIIFSVIGEVASGGWLIGLILGVAGGLLVSIFA